MASLLKIDVSPRGDHSVSRKLDAQFIEQLQQAHPGSAVVTRDLATTDIPFVDLPWIGGAYMLFLAWRIFRMSALQDSKPAPPVSLVGAAIFQYVNPKGWLISVTIGTLFMPPDANLLPALSIIFLVLVTINGTTATVWAAFGSSLRRWLADAKHRLVFNAALSAAIVATVVKMLWDLPR